LKLVSGEGPTETLMPRAIRTRPSSSSASKKTSLREAHRGKRHAADPKSEILSLQHSAGNRAVNELLKKPARDLIGRGNSTGSGKPLDAKVQHLMESRLGHEFKNVRVHTDAQASESAKSLGAKAYTTGNNVVFAAGEYEPRTIEGQQRIAHELTHVIQQRQSGLVAWRNDQISSPHDSSEREADVVGRTVARGMQAPAILAAGVGIQRDGKDDPIPLLDDFAKKFPDAAKLIRKEPVAMKLVKEAAAAGAQFGGYVEEGPKAVAAGGRAATLGSKVYVPKTRTDPVIAVSDFLFELNNAIRKPKFAVLDTEATKGSKGTLDAKTYAYKTVELEVEGMLRLGEVWFEMKKNVPKDKQSKTADAEFFLSDYEAVKNGKKTKDQLVKDVLKRTYDTGALKGKTVEQNYMDDYKSLSGGK